MLKPSTLIQIGLGLIGIASPFVWKQMPDWVTYPLLGVGLLLVGSGILSYRRHTKNSRRYPDWNIRDLFFHLDPRLKDEGLLGIDAGLNVRSVGREVMDKFSTGKLRAWGREVGHGTQVPIPPEYWILGELTRDKTGRSLKLAYAEGRR